MHVFPKRLRACVLEPWLGGGGGGFGCHGVSGRPHWGALAPFSRWPASLWPGDPLYGWGFRKGAGLGKGWGLARRRRAPVLA
ncbi:hypothetical protein MC885_004188 [Smutsia gigantea]|nr:hypothetical protein MC885_004188 [Smutsia gigantea]